MLAAADCTNCYTDQTIYDSEWIENTPNGISWLNLLTAQSIPEEMDGMDSLPTPVRSNSERTYSSSSAESCYVVLEIQRPRSVNETPNKVEQDEDEEEIEEEEEEVEIEELHFAQTKIDERNMDNEQLAVSLTTEKPMEEYAIESRQEQFFDVLEHAEVTQPTIQESPNEILFHTAKALSRFTKRMKNTSYVATKKERNFSSSSSDDEPLHNIKLKTIRKVNEYHPTVISAVADEQKSTKQLSNSSRYSTTSLDSIENRSIPSPSAQTRTTTTFSNLSSQRPLNPVQNQRSAPTMGTTTLTRTFAFDRACMEKYGRVQERKIEPIEIQVRPIYENINNEEIKLPPKTTEQTKPPSHRKNSLNCRSYTDGVPTSFYIGSEASVVEESDFQPQRSAPPPTSESTNLTKAPSLLCLVKKYARTATTEYRLVHDNANGNISAEPTLLEVKYLDGRLPLKDDHARESFRKSQTLTRSIVNRLNRIGISKMASTQDLSSGTTFNTSYRKRVFNRFRNLIELNTPEPPPPPPIPQFRPWQHKTISELLQERKHKVHNRRR